MYCPYFVPPPNEELIAIAIWVGSVITGFLFFLKVSLL